MTIHTHSFRLPFVLAGLLMLLSTLSPVEAGLFWPFRRAKQPPPPPPVNYYPPVQYPAPVPAYGYNGGYQPQPVAWQAAPLRPYYPPMPPPQVGGYPQGNGYPFGTRPALPAEPRPQQWQPVVYSPPVPQPAPVPQVRLGGAGSSLASAMSGECVRLARMGLRYQFGSMDPSKGGLDCSGSVKCVLERCGVRGVPRTASDQYVWLERAGTLTPLRRGADGDWILNRLRPGDLLFWRGTYVTNRVPDVSHVMIYLGRDSRTGKPMMFGARSSDRSKGLNGNAVDIYEFNPVPKGRSEFIGFGSVPR